jgi:hypothetical protein
MFIRTAWELSRMANTTTNKEVAKCAECKCWLDSLFTGIHIMQKEMKQKTVCDLCAAQLEIKGWVEIGRAK